MRFSVGLTGGIGSGKSTVARRFAALGAGIVDTDAIAHALTQAGGAAIAAIRKHFGPQFIASDGALDRARMREHVFADAGAKAGLESILHPLIRDTAEQQAQAAAGSSPYVVFVVPLLVESGTWRTRVTRVLVVDCSVETQVERVRQRSGWSADAVRSVIRTQAPRRERLDAADDVLVNDGADLAELDARVSRLHAFYLDCAQGCVAGHGVTIDA